MKKKFLTSALLIATLFVVMASFKESPKNIKKQEGSPLIFWTANCNYGPIEVFVNNVYQGDITKCYTSAPECASSGCVTVIIRGEQNVWKAQTKDGRFKWSSKPCRVPDRVCNSERLN